MFQLCSRRQSSSGRAEDASTAGFPRRGRRLGFTSTMFCPSSTEGIPLLRISASRVFHAPCEKGAKTHAIDPESGSSVPLFDPRRNDWGEHFCWREVHIFGLTPTGRATVAILRMNRPLIVEIRREEALLGRHLS